MSKIKKELCKLNKISKDKLKSMLEYDGSTLVGVKSTKIMNPYQVSIGKSPEEKETLVIGKLVGIDETKNSGDIAIVSIQTVRYCGDFYDPMPDRSVSIIVPIIDLYELSPEIFTAITYGVDDIFIDETDNAYIEGEECNEVFVLLGHFKKYKNKTFKKDKEINGVFSTEEDAKKMGEMLKEYGRLNDIEYTDYEIHNFLVM